MFAPIVSYLKVMIARLTNQSIYFDNITVWEEEIISERFSAENPNARYIDTSATAWDGVYRKYNRTHKRLARPFLAELRLLCKQKDLSLLVKDEREPSKYQPLSPDEINADFLPGITLKDFQIDAIRKVCTTECGVVSITTGGGKSEIMAAICKVMNCPTVIIAEQIVVIDQLRDRLDLRDVCSEPGLFYAGKMPTGELIIIGSIQSLVLPKKKPEKPSRENYKDTESSTAAQKFKQAQKRYAASLKGYQSRTKKARALHKLIGKCEMILVDECVDEDTYINTESGLIRAVELADRVEHGIDSRVMVNGHAYSITGISKSRQEAYCITTSTGRKLIGSANHLCATYVDGFRVDRHIISLQYGDALLSCRNNLNPVFDDGFGCWYDLGLFVGDGHMLNNRQVKFGVRKDCADWIAWSKIASVRWCGTSSAKYNKRGDLVLRLHVPELCSWLRELGFTPGRKMGSIDPKFEFTSLSAIINFLRGLFDSDGSIGVGRAAVVSIDLKLMEFVQILLSRIGIMSSIGLSGRAKQANHHDQWLVRVTGAEFVKFMHLVSFGFSRKRYKMHEYINIKDSNRMIDPKPYFERWLKSGIKKCCLAKSIGVGDLTCIRGKISLNRLLQWQDLLAGLSSIIIDDYYTAKTLLGISYDKISKHSHMPIMTVYNHTKRGDNTWKHLVETIQSKLAIPIVDHNLDGYGIEFVRDVSYVGVKNLIDFQVDDVESFEANGLLVHNCDLAVGNTYKNLFRHWFKGRRRIGFTGTPYDDCKPVQRLILNEHLGSVIYQQNRIQVEETGLIVPLEYYMLAFGEDGNPKDSSAYDIALDDWMIYNEDFHRLVKAICNRHPDEGTLVLVERHDLGHALTALIPDSQFVYGDTPKKKRPGMLQAFERRDRKVLIGGKNVRRGLDLSGGCENLILATGGKLVSEFDQRIGRARRQNERGKARVYDFLFLCNKYLYAHSRNRLKAAVAMGYKTQVVFRNGTIDGEKFVKSRFRRPRISASSSTG